MDILVEHTMHHRDVKNKSLQKLPPSLPVGAVDSALVQYQCKRPGRFRNPAHQPVSRGPHLVPTATSYIKFSQEKINA